MQARFYAPWYGRFLSPDPARDQHFEQTQSWNIYSYVQNNPTMNIDPNGMEIRLARNDPNLIKKYQEAKAYLMKSGTMRKAFATVESSPKVTWVYVSPGKDDQSTGGKVAWDPTRGLALKTDDDKKTTGEVQSPALQLGHEMGHRAEELTNPNGYEKNTETPAGKYDTKEEQRNGQQVETPAAKELGEPTRANHKGDMVPADNTTTKIKRPDPKPEPKNRQNDE